MHVRGTAALLCSALALWALALAAAAPASPAASRLALAEALGEARPPVRAFGSSTRPRPAALRSMVRESAARYASAGDELRISSGDYGSAELESVAAVLRSLDHGPELAGLSVFLATPEQLSELCGEETLACYFPSEEEMVVAGVNGAVDGVSREFAIAHEYGHHIAHSRAGGALPAIEAGTVRWATYERVCQLSRRGRLFPGHQDGHYWQNPGEAFAESYAALNRPGEGAGWDFTPLLEPSATALAKIHADVARPWSGPVQARWRASLAAPPASPDTGAVRTGAPAIAAARAVGGPPSRLTRLLRTPLDGPVAVSVQAAAGARLRILLRDRDSGRPLARAATGPDGGAELSYSNCGHAALVVEARAIDGPSSFEATLTRP